MKLTGLQIFKLLPNTNCKECGFQTCLAFAMKLAARQASVDSCPYISEEGRAKLGAAATPPMKLVVIGKGENEVRIGEELVMFRHEKSFIRKTALAPQVDDLMDGDAMAAMLRNACDFSVERAGEKLRLDLIAVKEKSGDVERFARAVRLARDSSRLPLVIISRRIECLKKALETAGETRPLVWGACRENAEGVAELSREFSVPVVVEGAGIEELAGLALKVNEMGVEDVVLAPAAGGPAERLRELTLLRRRALERSLKGTGYPTIISSEGEGYEGALEAAGGICKYASVIVICKPEKWQYLPLLTLRQNIFTDPQKPLQVNPGVYRIGEADRKSPLLVTTNFSLTYFMVSTEVEASEIPSHLLVIDAEGQSVLTAWAAGKFNADVIAKAVIENRLDESVPHRRIIIPGYVAMISGELEDKLTGWNVMVGPQESADIPNYLSEIWK